MKNKLFLAIAPMLLAACAQGVDPVVMDASHHQQLKGKSITVTAHAPTPFYAETTGISMLLGSAFSQPFHYSRGRRILNENDVEDPSSLIAKQVIDAMGLSLNTRFLDEEVEEIPTPNGESQVGGKLNEPNKLMVLYPEGDYILDVDTAFWGLGTTGVNNVWYNADVRLIERNSQSVVAADTCRYVSSKVEEGSTPTYGELVDRNNAQLLKDYLSNAAKTCASDFLQKNLKIGSHVVQK